MKRAFLYFAISFLSPVLIAQDIEVSVTNDLEVAVENLSALEKALYYNGSTNDLNRSVAYYLYSLYNNTFSVPSSSGTYSGGFSKFLFGDPFRWKTSGQSSLTTKAWRSHEFPSGSSVLITDIYDTLIAVLPDTRYTMQQAAISDIDLNFRFRAFTNQVALAHSSTTNYLCSIAAALQQQDTTLSNISGGISSVNVNISNVNNAIGSLNTSVGGVRTAVDGVGSAVAAVASNVESLHTPLANISGGVSGLRDDIGDLSDMVHHEFENVMSGQQEASRLNNEAISNVVRRMDIGNSNLWASVEAMHSNLWNSASNIHLVARHGASNIVDSVDQVQDELHDALTDTSNPGTLYGRIDELYNVIVQQWANVVFPRWESDYFSKLDIPLSDIDSSIDDVKTAVVDIKSLLESFNFPGNHSALMAALQSIQSALNNQGGGSDVPANVTVVGQVDASVTLPASVESDISSLEDIAQQVIAAPDKLPLLIEKFLDLHSRLFPHSGDGLMDLLVQQRDYLDSCTQSLMRITGQLIDGYDPTLFGASFSSSDNSRVPDSIPSDSTGNYFNDVVELLNLQANAERLVYRSIRSGYWSGYSGNVSYMDGPASVKADYSPSRINRSLGLDSGASPVENIIIMQKAIVNLLGAVTRIQSAGLTNLQLIARSLVSDDLGGVGGDITNSTDSILSSTNAISAPLEFAFSSATNTLSIPSLQLPSLPDSSSFQSSLSFEVANVSMEQARTRSRSSTFINIDLSRYQRVFDMVRHCCIFLYYLLLFAVGVAFIYAGAKLLIRLFRLCTKIFNF